MFNIRLTRGTTTSDRIKRSTMLQNVTTPSALPPSMIDLVRARQAKEEQEDQEAWQAYQEVKVQFPRVFQMLADS
jgi:hypothetical protein